MSFPSPGNLPDPGIELTSPAMAVGSSTTEPPGKPLEQRRWPIRHLRAGGTSEKVASDILVFQGTKLRP